MTDEKKKAIMNCTSFDEILNEENQEKLYLQIGEWPRRHPAFYTFPHICRFRQTSITYNIIMK